MQGEIEMNTGNESWGVGVGVGVPPFQSFGMQTRWRPDGGCLGQLGQMEMMGVGPDGRRGQMRARGGGPDGGRGVGQMGWDGGGDTYQVLHQAFAM